MMTTKQHSAPSGLDALDPQLPHGHPTSAPSYTVVKKAAEEEFVYVINTSLWPANTSQGALPPGARDEALAQVEVAVLAAIFALAVGGNSCVLVALARRRKIASRMHMFILHLSVADLLVALFNILPQLLWDISGVFIGGDFLCRLVKFLQVFVMYLSTYVLVMTAVDRYRAICHPLSNYNWSQRTVNIIITAIYILSAVLSLPQPLLFKYQLVPETGHFDCWGDFSPPWLLKFYILSFTLAVYVIPFFILVFAYGSICFTIWAKQPRSAAEEDVNGRQPEGARGQLKAPEMPGAGDNLPVPPVSGRRGGQPVHSSSGTTLTRNRNGYLRPRAHSMRGFSRAKLKTVKLTFVVILAYLFCWSPFFISQLWWMYDPSQEDNKAVVIMVLLGSLNSCCNPWIYLAFSGNLLRHLVPCCRSPPHCCVSATRSRNPAHYVTPSPTPSATEPRGIKMVALLGRRAARQYGGVKMTPLAGVGRRYDVSDDSHQHKASRHAFRESLTSLLTMRMSRNSSPQLRSSAQSSPGKGHKEVADCQQVRAEVLDERPPRQPSSHVLAAVTSSSSSSSGGSNASASGKPRSPHVHKRARLHERPAEEVAEAQMKWEHNMGMHLKRSCSLLTSSDDTTIGRNGYKASDANHDATKRPASGTADSLQDKSPI